MIPSVVDELKQKQLLTEDLNEKNGLIAQVAWVRDAINIPLFLVKSDGGYGYDSTDAAAIRYRIQSLHSDWLIYVTDSGQCDHFRGIFSLANRAGWLGLNGASNVMDFTKDKMNENIAAITAANVAKDHANGHHHGSKCHLFVFCSLKTSFRYCVKPGFKVVLTRWLNWFD